MTDNCIIECMSLTIISNIFQGNENICHWFVITKLFTAWNYHHFFLSFTTIFHYTLATVHQSIFIGKISKVVKQVNNINLMRSKPNSTCVCIYLWASGCKCTGNSKQNHLFICTQISDVNFICRWIFIQINAWQFITFLWKCQTKNWTILSCVCLCAVTARLQLLYYTFTLHNNWQHFNINISFQI